MTEAKTATKNFELSEEVLRIARLLKALSQQADSEEIQYSEPGQLVDAIYSAAEHLDRIAEELAK